MNIHEEILNAIKDPISFVDKRYRYVYVNNAYSVYFHSRPDELIGKYITDFVDKDHFYKVIKPRIDEGLAGKNVQYEQVIDLRTGLGERRFLTSYHPHYNEKKEIDGIVTTVIDKTEENTITNKGQKTVTATETNKKVKPEITETEGNYKLLVDNINDLVCEIDENGVFTFLNQRYKDILGYEPADLMGKNAIDLIHPDDLEKSLAKYQQLKDKDKRRVDVWRFKHSNGNYRVIESRASFYEHAGNVKRTVVVSRDITDSVDTEEALNLNVQRYRKAQEIGKVGNWEYNLQTTEFWGSVESKRIYGFDPESELFSTETVESCIPERERVHQSLIDLVEKDKPYNLEFDILTYDKHIRKTIISIAELERDSNGNPLRITGVIQDITDRKDAEKKLKESETKYRILFEESNDAIFIHNLDGTIIDVNKQAVNLFGYSREEYLGQSLFQFHPESELKKMKRAKEESIQKSFVQFETKYVAKGGEIRDIDVSVKLFDKEQGLVQGILRDITTRKQYEQKILEQNQEYEVLNEELRQSNLELLTAKEIALENEAKFKSYIDNAPDGVFIANEKGRYMDVNKAACTLTGFSKDELLNMSIVDLIPDAGKQSAREHFQKLIKDGAASGSNVFLTKNNETRYWNVDAVKISETLFLGFAKDITERVVNDLELQMAKETAELNERELDLTLEATTDGIWKWNFLEERMYFSPNYYRMLGYEPNEFEATYDSWVALMHPDDKENAVDTATIWLEDKEGVYENNFRLKTKSGEYIWIRATGKVVEYNADGEAIRMIGNHTDITSIKKVQQELIIAKEEAEEANRLKTEFLKNMSHEVRTPMNGIIGFADMLDEEDLTNERRSYYSKIIQNSSRQLLRVINDILEISTLETKQISMIKETINLNDFYMELFSVFSLRFKERNIPIYLRKGLHDNECEIVSDRTKLNKILSNLIENALKFTNEGFVEIGYYIEGDNLVLYVKDTGIGISPQKQNLIFERFSQESAEISSTHGGLGLGLSISKENAQLLGGDIILESIKGVGSTFFVTIPFEPVIKNVKSTENMDELSKSNNDVTILVVEDEEINYLYIETIFEEEKNYKFRIVHARNGKEAIEQCQVNENIDIVLMDLKMPVMNGYDASKIIKEKRPELPIIAQTAYSTQSDRILALNSGCDDFISKPIDRDKFFKMVYKHLKITH